MEQDDGDILGWNWNNFYSSVRRRLYVFTFYIGIWRTAGFC